MYSNLVFHEALNSNQSDFRLGNSTISISNDAKLHKKLAIYSNSEELLNRARLASRGRQLKLNVDKTKVMSIDKNNGDEDLKSL